MSERVYSLGRGPWQCKGVGFGVSQAAGSPRFQPNDGVLLREMRYSSDSEDYIEGFRVCLLIKMRTYSSVVAHW